MVTSFEERGDQEIMKEVKKVPGYPEGKMFEALVSQKMSQRGAQGQAYVLFDIQYLNEINDFCSL